jgi:thiol:disulfide interchange protein DsbD
LRDFATKRAGIRWPFSLMEINAAVSLRIMSKRSLFLSIWRRFVVAALLLLGGAQAVIADEEFLEPEVAFKLAARAADARTVEVTVTPAPGYYLYREQFKFEAPAGTTLGAPVIPPGKTKFDETFQKNVETYHEAVRVAIPVQQAPARFRLLVTSQGCADKGLCYPPLQRGVDVALTGFGGGGSMRVLNAADTAAGLPEASVAAAAATTPAVPEAGTAPVPAPTLSAAGNDRLDGALRDGKFWPIVGVFLVAGVLLSLTPCVLPMLPILSSIIVGQGARVSRGRGFSLALSYSLGMALVYTALGIAAGLAGAGLAAALQNPWVLTAFALGLAALSLSMFGVYELQLPAGFSGRMAGASQRLPAGRFVPVFVMGGLSALIVSPCVAAPLAGALVYLSRSGDVVLGGSALFSLAAGMSVPLLLVGASAGALLPRAGAWMDEVKRLFGLLLLGVAVWMLQSVLPAALSLALWGALLISAAVLLLSPGAGQAEGGWSRSLWRRCAAAVIGVVGLLQMVGAVSGGSDPLQPLAQLARRGDGAAASASVALPFAPLRSGAELDAALRSAGRPVMLDFYADWCVSCKEMERFTFSDAAVQAKLRGATLLRADVTANNADDRELLKRFGLFGPPGTIFFDAGGREVPNARIVGFQNTDQFLKTLQAVGL